ncbi:OmpA family protein [Actinomyces oris]|uniref:OmpA family protein n=1 Tax=Actinomyces oris TaxID=544580 RepID=UPI003F8A3629
MPAASGAPQGWQELDAHVMGHHLGIQVSPLVRRDETTTVLALKLTRAKDDPAVKDIAESTSDSSSNTLEASRPLSRPGRLRTSDWGANGVRLLDLPTNRAWVATASIENKVKDNYNKLSLKPGESTSCFVLFGPVDAKKVTVFVPQAGFVTVNVLDSSAAAASGIDFSGKGESEPKIKDTSDEARAVNRRVEITLTPTGGTTTKNTPTPTNGSSATPNPTSSKLPGPKGPVAKGADGVTVKHDNGAQLTITVDHLTRANGYLLGQLHTTINAKTDSAPSGLERWLGDKEVLFSNSRSEDGSSEPTERAADGLTLLAGGERIYPADYLDAGFKTHVPLTELQLTPHIKAGTTTVCVVWPDPGGDTITLDHAAPTKHITDLAFRLTDIPIKNT